MIGELRAGFLLFASLAFLLMITAIFTLSMVMRPDRWSERNRLAGEARSTAA
ncbi:MAG: hypothetical protein H8K04_01430 [Nitrospira sp.]